MSERQLRDEVESLLPMIELECGSFTQDSISQALAENPDLVVLLRWANKKRACYLKLAEDASKGYSWNPRYDEKFYRGKAGMAAEIQHYCLEFVRLTDGGGWEWAEKEGDGAE